MLKLLRFLFFFEFLIFEISSAGDVSSSSELSKATTNFALKLLKVNEKFNESTFFSPASISICVGMAYMGSKAETKSQMNKILFNNLDDQKIKDQMKELSQNLYQPSSAYNLSLANRLYLQKNFGIQKTYVDTLKTYFDTKAELVDFVNDPEIIRSNINDWVESETDGKIKELLSQPFILQGVKLVLVNVIYFKGDWLNPFSEQSTKKSTFYSAENNAIQIDMMKKRHANFLYQESENLRTLGMPYVGDNLVMYILLPKQKYGLAEIESGLNGETLTNLLRGTTKRKLLEVQIPKFKFEQKFDLRDAFELLGMSDMFNSTKADFSGIDGTRTLYVSKVIHKAFIEVNEKGSEAAGSTAVLLPPGSAPMAETEPSFIADHPFLFTIVDKRNFNPLFVGRFVGN